MKTEGTDDEANESVEPVVGIAPNNENTRVVCNKVSPQKGALNRHAEVHSTDVPFECDICGKNFKRKDVLKRHMQIHSTDTHFKCDICGKIFPRKDALKSHQKGTRKAGKCIRTPGVDKVSRESVKEGNIDDVLNSFVLPSSTKIVRKKKMLNPFFQK